MGQQVIKSAKIAKNFKLVSVTENRIINKKISGLKPQLNSESAFQKNECNNRFHNSGMFVGSAENCFQAKKKSCDWNHGLF